MPKKKAKTSATSPPPKKRTVRSFRRISDEEQSAILRRLENHQEDLLAEGYPYLNEMLIEIDAPILSLGGEMHPENT